MKKFLSMCNLLICKREFQGKVHLRLFLLVILFSYFNLLLYGSTDSETRIRRFKFHHLYVCMRLDPLCVLQRVLPKRWCVNRVSFKKRLNKDFGLVQVLIVCFYLGRESPLKVEGIVS